MRFLEEFWYGNIEPTEYDTNACKEYKEVLHLIARNEEKLLASIQTLFVSIRPWQSAYCSKIALSWVPG